MFLFRETVAGDPGVGVAFTDATLDLGDAAADDVRRSGLATIERETGARPVVMRQVHGADVAVVDGPDPAPEPAPEADALVTTRPGLALLTRAADCVPVLMADPDAGVIAAVHAGRPGVAAGVVPAAVAAMRAHGADRVTAWVGPHICGACYEVPEQLRAEVSALVPATHATTSWGTPALDLGAGVHAQLAEAGCRVHQVARCTREHDDLHSYRRDGARAGRCAGVIWRTA